MNNRITKNQESGIRNQEPRIRNACLQQSNQIQSSHFYPPFLVFVWLRCVALPSSSFVFFVFFVFYFAHITHALLFLYTHSHRIVPVQICTSIQASNKRSHHFSQLFFLIHSNNPDPQQSILFSFLTSTTLIPNGKRPSIDPSPLSFAVFCSLLQSSPVFCSLLLSSPVFCSPTLHDSLSSPTTSTLIGAVSGQRRLR